MKFIKENLRVIISVFIALVLIVLGAILLVMNKDNETVNVDEEVNKEQQISEITGMSGEDAIDLVKKNFYSDNYEFKAEVTADSLYRVIVTNIVDNNETIYYVDPSNGQAYVDIDTN